MAVFVPLFVVKPWVSHFNAKFFLNLCQKPANLNHVCYWLVCYFDNFDFRFAL